MPIWLIVLMHVAAIAYALVGGTFLAFSDFIMRSLSRTGDTGGIDAMQTINREVYRWIFMTLLIGMVPVSFVLVGSSFFISASPSGIWFASAGLVYLVGCFGVTAAFNVPMNERLAKMDLAAPGTNAYWTGTYLPRWTLWNTVRTVACVVSALLMLIGTTLMVQAEPVL